MKIGEVAAQAGVNVETLRYYERRGLLLAPGRQDSGYRDYADDAVRTVRFIKRAQDLGFTLADIAVLLSLAAGGPGTCREVRALAIAKIENLNAKIQTLGAMKHSLLTLIESCDRADAERECPLLESIGAIE